MKGEAERKGLTRCPEFAGLAMQTPRAEMNLQTCGWKTWFAEKVKVASTWIPWSCETSNVSSNPGLSWEQGWTDGDV